MSLLKSAYTVLIDTRERVPLKFPSWVVIQDPRRMGDAKPVSVRLYTRNAPLITGDYALEGSENQCLIERKAGSKEVFGNTQTNDWTRFHAALQRLECAKHPVLLWERDPSKPVDGSPSSRAQHGSWQPDMPHEGSTHAALFWACLQRRVSLIMVSTSTIPQRLAVGELVARLLIMGSLTCPTNTTPSYPNPPIVPPEPTPTQPTAPARKRRARSTPSSSPSSSAPSAV